MARRLAALLSLAFLIVSCSDALKTPSQPSSAGAGPGLPSPRLTVRVDNRASAVAVVGVSEVTFDARETPGDKLKYRVDYGDGESSTDVMSSHVYKATGTFTATLTVTDAAARTTTTTSAPIVVKAILGSWFHAGFNQAVRRYEVRRLMIANQDGAQVRGTYESLGSKDRSFTGQVAGDRRLSLATDDGFAQLEGSVPDSIDQHGESLTLSMHGGGADGQSLPFTPVAGEPTGPWPLARLAVRPPEGLGNAIIGLENLYDASQSIGDGLSYAIEFGDDQFALGQTSAHALRLDPLQYQIVMARAVVVDRFGRSAVATQNYGVFTLQTCGYGDNWDHEFLNPANGRTERRRLVITAQDGRDVTGWYTHPEGWANGFRGTLSGSNEIRLTLDDGMIGFAGTVGHSLVNHQSGMTLRLHFRGGSADGQDLLFFRYSVYC